jgi:hypothetical protein
MGGVSCGFKVVIVIVFLSLIVASIPTTAQSQETSDWTVLVYMSGDSSLSSNLASDLDEMKRVASSDSLNIVVLADRSGPGDTAIYWLNNSVVEEIPLNVVNASWSDELNLGDAQTLEDFVIWGIASYPADNLILDLWGHGNGWEGLCPDKDDTLTMEELGQAMDSIIDAGITLNIVSFDACQMGMLETIYELRNAADYAIVSEKDVPADGWPYYDVLSILVEDPSISPEEFGKQMIDAYMDWGLLHSRYSLTASLINLQKIDDLVSDIEIYIDEIGGMVPYFNREIIRARAFTEKYDGNSEYDLQHLLENINNETKCKRLEILSSMIILNFNELIVHERHWTNLQDEPADNAHGLSIHFPGHTPSTRYLSTGFAVDTNWDELMTEIAPFFTFPTKTEVSLEINTQSYDIDEDGLYDQLAFSTDIPDIPSGQFLLEVYSPNGTIAYSHESSSSGLKNLQYNPEVLGRYSAAFYVWSADGELLNYTLVENGLTKEGLSVITGSVTSDIGRGQRWVQVSLYDPEGNIIGSTVTDMKGEYTLELKVPTDTDGIQLTLSCGFGAQRQNHSIDSLLTINTYDFQLGDAHWSVLSLVYVAIIMNLIATSLIITWSVVSRKEKPPI